MLTRLTIEHVTSICRLMGEACPRRRVTRSCVARLLFAERAGCDRGCWGMFRDRKLLGVVSVLTRGRAGFVQLLAVDPRARRGGLGSCLLRFAEQRLARRGAQRVQIEGSAPAYFRPGVPTADEPSTRFYASQGYRAVGTRRSLRAELGGVSLEPVDRDDSVALQRVDARGLEQQCSTIALAFGDDWLQEAQLAARDSPPALHVALDGRRLVGFAASGVSGPDVFGPMGTLTGYRRRGIGRALLLSALADIRSRGHDEALIGWLGPEAFYRRLLPSCQPVDYRVVEKSLRPATEA